MSLKGKQTKPSENKKKKNTPVKSISGRYRTFFLAGALMFTVLLFSDSITFHFTNWDDMDYVLNNALIRDLSPIGIYKIFTTPVLGMYNPIPFVVYTITFKIDGLNPKYFHLMNILLHLLATVAVYHFIFKLCQRFLTAFLVALLFAIHPMHVSVVTWVAESKTSLEMIFYFWGLYSYIRYTETGYKVKQLLVPLVLLTLACLSKPSAVTFSPMLFLIDYYKGRKLDKQLILEKVPFFIVSLIFGILTLLTHSQSGDSIFEVNRQYSLGQNLLVSNYAFVFYIEKLFWPLNLSTIYPYPDSTQPFPLKYYLALPVLPLLVLLVVKSGRYRKDMIFGMVFFLIAISVLLRIVPSGFFGMANHYTYLSYTGFFFILAQFITNITESVNTFKPAVKKYTLMLLVLYLIFCSWRTTIRIQVWQNTITLFNDIIAKNPDFVMAYNQRAIGKRDIKDYPGSFSDLNKAIELDPGYTQAYINRGLFKGEIKQYDEGVKDLSRAIEIDSTSTNAYCNRGKLYLEMSQAKLAFDDFSKAIENDSTNGAAYFNRALIKISWRDTTGAIADWKHAYTKGLTRQAASFLKEFDPGWE